ncbi:MAG: dihydropyrimidine dehydrogenase [Ignavibacteria bacterium]|nr:dihydropyrimidine dehydrogenase [Ignavibacteria bacterium]
MNVQQARIESERCLQCFDAPCTAACPTHIDVTKFIGMIRSGNILGAAEVVKTSNALANTCGSVCPQEIFCQSVCTRAQQDSPIQIRELHRFATQYERERGYSIPKVFPKKVGKVAVIGAGPSGLGCAYELAKFGYDVYVYDSGRPGGVPRNSIPSFRLADDELDLDTKFLSQFFALKRQTIDAKSFKNIVQSHGATFVAIGLGLDRSLGIPGENLKGVVPVLTFLEKAKAKPRSMKIGKKVVIVGGGNVSLDAAATAKRLGAESVILIYRRSEKEMRVWKSELEEARAQGVEIRFLTNPVKVVGKSRVTGIKCRNTRLSKKKDKTGRPIPVEVQGSDFVLEANAVIVAIGQKIKADWLGGIKRTSAGYIKVDDDFQTSLPGVFAGGDVIAGEGTVVQSVAHGKHAAQAIHEFLSAK